MSSSYLLALLILFLATSSTSAQLSPSYYSKSCPRASAIIKTFVRDAVAKERRMGASLLRLHFHDCFVQGCDASVLLADTDTFTGEQSAFPNKGSLRGFEVIDNIKMQLEAACRQTVSCADILAIAARDAVSALGGPSWIVPLGRRDSTTTSLALAYRNLPGPFFDLGNLTTQFASKGLSTTDLVALSGAHTIGQARCINFRGRMYNDTYVDPDLLSARRAICPLASGGDADNNLAPLDVATGNTFDNAYYRDLVTQRGLLHSDQVLYNGGSTDNIVRAYAASPARFYRDFAAAMVRMGNITPLTGSQGEIRLTCSRVN